MTTSQPTPEIRRRSRNDRHAPWRSTATVACSVAGAAALAAVPAVPAILAGMNLGNHNEALLVPNAAPRRVRREVAVQGQHTSSSGGTG